MKLRKPLIITAIALTSVFAGGATPASAEDTITTFELTAGLLTMTIGGAGVAALTDEASGVPANDITGSLGLVTVTDDRGDDAEWVVSASSTAFTGSNGSSSTGVTYSSGAIAPTTGSITVVAGAVTALTGVAAAVVSPSVLSGNNTAEWTPTLVVSLPAGALAGTYTGTVTTSIL